MERWRGREVGRGWRKEETEAHKGGDETWWAASKVGEGGAGKSITTTSRRCNPPQFLRDKGFEGASRVTQNFRSSSVKGSPVCPPS